MILALKQIGRMVLSPILSRFQSLEESLEHNRLMMAQMLIKDRCLKEGPVQLTDVELKVFSQWGEDGIIQYLISRVPIATKTFVEFGVEDYRESNTRFLLMNNEWTGLVIDGSPRHVSKIKKSNLYWRYNLTAIASFVTKDNINGLISSNGITGDIGLLSVDIDGNDYWVWEAINVISPRIVICEYNSVFGSKDAVTIPYSDQFNRTRAHYSNLYFGASLGALCQLGKAKGYVFAGSNSAGSNAFFVREDVASNILAIDSRAGYVESKPRESRDQNGRLTFLNGRDRIKLIEGLKVVDVTKHCEIYVRDIVL